ncbi:MAG: hypothetical protein IJH61_07725, partial [Eubacteriaceae bacterium]|nr:hypothetical protein [Eubacteriaceae bacterium]
NKAKIYAVTLSLIIILALSATAFAEGPMGSPQMDRMQSGQHTNNNQTLFCFLYFQMHQLIHCHNIIQNY